MAIKAADLDLDSLRLWQEKAYSSLGGVNPDQSVTLAGFDLFSGLVGNLSLAGCFHLYVKKSVPSQEVERLLSAIVAATVYPDIRIWPNRAVALSASSGTGNAAGIASGMLGMEGKMFGGECVTQSFRFLCGLMDAESKGDDIGRLIDQLKQDGEKFPGFGRPLVKGDERLKPILRVAAECGLDKGEFLVFGRRVESLLLEKFGIKFNVAALIACLLGDMGFSFSEVRAFGTLFPMISFLGIFHEHSKADARPVFPLSIRDVNYLGQLPSSAEMKDGI
ncbi:MAG: citrate/2-methylcitrate synthase [Candidatus Riflebacteria bacterium]